MATGPAEGLDLVDELVAGGALSGFHPLHVVRGEMLARLGRHAEARDHFLRAAAMCTNAAERALLERKAAAATAAAPG
jgi:predicted RNA polymerase sigma factor